jgi:hypothetical protein
MELHFKGEEVLISRDGDRVILEPVIPERTRSRRFLDLAGYPHRIFPTPKSRLRWNWSLISIREVFPATERGSAFRFHRVLRAPDGGFVVSQSDCRALHVEDADPGADQRIQGVLVTLEDPQAAYAVGGKRQCEGAEDLDQGIVDILELLE